MDNPNNLMGNPPPLLWYAGEGQPFYSGDYIVVN